MANHSTINIKDKPLLYCTVGEFIQAIREGLGVDTIDDEDTPIAEADPPIHLCTGIKSLAKFLDCHYNTAQKLYASGVLDPAVYRNGKLIVFNKDLVLDLLKVRNKTNNNRRWKSRLEKR